jgi:hypothetical protein
MGRGNRAGALALYQQVIDRFPTDSARPRAFVLAASVQLDSGDTVAACKSVAATDSASVSDRFLVSKLEQISAVCPHDDAAAPAGRADTAHVATPQPEKDSSPDRPVEDVPR